MTSIYDYDPASDHLSRSVPYDERYPSRNPASNLTPRERDAIGTFCTAIGASWGNWCQSPSNRFQYYIGKFVIYRAGIGSLLLGWDQDNVWQLASQYYRAFRNGEYVMRLPVNEAEAHRFQDQAHDAKLYTAVKKLMRLKYGPRWIQDGGVDKAARLELARHEVAAMAYGRMDVRFGEPLVARDERHSYYAAVRAACHGVPEQRDGAGSPDHSYVPPDRHPLYHHIEQFVERFDSEHYDVRGDVRGALVPRRRDASPPPQAPPSPSPVQAPPPPLQASPPPVQAPPPPPVVLASPGQAPPSVQAASPVQAQPPMPASAAEVQAPVQAPLAAAAPAAPPAFLAPPAPPPWAHAMAAAFGQRLAPMEVDEGGDDGMSCRVCFDKERQWALQPCGHAAVCGTCFVRIWGGNKLCPICRVPIEGFMRVYL